VLHRGGGLVAAAAVAGLVVPVLRNVEDMSFADIEKAIAEYAVKAKVSCFAC
jgi:2-oxoglutarate dehydrogenase E2 component (dihydrolipoamide succinyltransferase)